MAIWQRHLFVLKYYLHDKVLHYKVAMFAMRSFLYEDRWHYLEAIKVTNNTLKFEMYSEVISYDGMIISLSLACIWDWKWSWNLLTWMPLYVLCVLLPGEIVPGVIWKWQGVILLSNIQKDFITSERVYRKVASTTTWPWTPKSDVGNTKKHFGSDWSFIL